MYYDNKVVTIKLYTLNELVQEWLERGDVPDGIQELINFSLPCDDRNDQDLFTITGQPVSKDCIIEEFCHRYFDDAEGNPNPLYCS